MIADIDRVSRSLIWEWATTYNGIHSEIPERECMARAIDAYLNGELGVIPLGETLENMVRDNPRKLMKG